MVGRPRSFRLTQAVAGIGPPGLARVGRIGRSSQRSRCARRSDRPMHLVACLRVDAVLYARRPRLLNGYGRDQATDLAGGLVTEQRWSTGSGESHHSFCNSSADIARVTPIRLQCDPTPRAIVDLGKTLEINVTPASAQRQSDGRRAGLKIRWKAVSRKWTAGELSKRISALLTTFSALLLYRGDAAIGVGSRPTFGISPNWQVHLPQALASPSDRITCRLDPHFTCSSRECGFKSRRRY
jgi:hypothetical protein